MTIILRKNGGALRVLEGTVIAGQHATHHSKDGSDEIIVEDLASDGVAGEVLTADGAGGTAMDPIVAQDHAASHQNGGGDEISVAGLSGVLADAQTAASHVATHENGGGDELSVAGLSGALADPQTPAAHAASHELGGFDEINVTGLVGAGGSGGAGYTLIEEYIHSAGNASSLDLAAVLDGDNDGGYYIELQMLNPANQVAFYHLRLNGAIWVLGSSGFHGYQTGGHFFGTSFLDAVSRSEAQVLATDRAGPGFCWLPDTRINQPSRSARRWFAAGNTGTILVTEAIGQILTPAPSANIISMGIQCTNSAQGGTPINGIGDGSRMALYKTTG